MCLKLEKYKSKSSNLISKLDALSPLKTLSRGYSVVENENHKVIKSKNDVEVGNNISITFSDGKINATVKE